MLWQIEHQKIITLFVCMQAQRLVHVVSVARASDGLPMYFGSYSHDNHMSQSPLYFSSTKGQSASKQKAKYYYQAQFSQSWTKALKCLTFQAERESVYQVTGHFSLRCITLTVCTMLILSPFYTWTGWKHVTTWIAQFISFNPKHSGRFSFAPFFKYILHDRI